MAVGFIGHGMPWRHGVFATQKCTRHLVRWQTVQIWRSRIMWMLRKLFLVSHPTNIKLSLHNYNTSMLSAFFGRWATQRPTKQRQSKTKAKQNKGKARFSAYYCIWMCSFWTFIQKNPDKKIPKIDGEIQILPQPCALFYFIFWF